MLFYLFVAVSVSRIVFTQASFSHILSKVTSNRYSCFQRLARADDDDSKRKRGLDRDFLSIAVPAFFQQAAVPLADLVDAAFLSKLEPGALGGVGIARASHSAVSKLYNTPLSKSSISLIASKCAAATNMTATQQAKDELSVAVTSALCLGLLVGLSQMIVFTLAAGPILKTMGIESSSSMAPTAISYMRAKALSAPSTTLWLVVTGAFRGLGDSWTPFLCAILLNICNVMFDPVFITTLGMGAAGAAHSTTISQTVALVPMMWILHSRVRIQFKNQLEQLAASLSLYLNAGIYLLGRTLARVAAFAFCSRQSAQLGSLGASAYSVTFHIGFWITLLCESVAVGTQALVSREVARKSNQSHQIVNYLALQAILSGAVISGVASLATWIFRHRIIAALCKSADVQIAVLSCLPAFLVTQVVKGVAFAVNGLILGKMDWSFSFWSIWLANIACFVTLKVGPAPQTVGRIWMAWTAFMATQAISGFVRYMYSNAKMTQTSQS